MISSSNMDLGPNEDIMLKTRIGSMLFTVTLDKSFFEPGNSFDVEKHNHATYEIHFVLSGSFTLEVNGALVAVNPNEYYFIGPGVYHGYRAHSSEPVCKYSFKMDFQTLGMEEEFFPAEENEKMREILENVRFFLSQDAQKNLQIMDEIRHELQNQYIGFYTSIQALFSRLFVNVIRDVSLSPQIGYAIPDRLFHERRGILIEDFFESSYHKNVRATDLAERLHVSIRQLNRILQETFGMSFKQKLLEKRIEIAKNLLKNTAMPVKAISRKVGYDTESNFSAMFKLKNNCTPIEYRAENRTAKEHTVGSQ